MLDERLVLAPGQSAVATRNCGACRHVRPDPEPARPTWRITCFVVDRRYRRRGVAGVVLDAALEAIRQRGGGIVEAYPVVSWTHGPEGTNRAVYVDGVGPVGPAWGGFNNVSTSGVVSMFANRGFTPVGICGTASKRVRDAGAQGDHVVMRKVVRARRAD